MPLSQLLVVETLEEMQQQALPLEISSKDGI
jgi:hypothetical protein